MTLILHDHATKRLCGTCISWHRENCHPHPDKNGNPEPYLVASCAVHKLPKRGSDACGKWTKHLRPAVVDGNALKQGEDGLWR